MQPTPITYIIPNLYIGDKYNACDADQLRKLKITHIVNCAKGLPDKFHDRRTPLPPSARDDELSFLYHRCELVDSSREDIGACFKATFSFIDEALENKDANNQSNTVFIHCCLGKSRAPSVCIAYIMFKYKWSLEKAFRFVCKQRPIAAPNSGFLKALLTLEKQIFGLNTMKLAQAKCQYTLMPLQQRR